MQLRARQIGRDSGDTPPPGGRRIALASAGASLRCRDRDPDCRRQGTASGARSVPALITIIIAATITAPHAVCRAATGRAHRHRWH